LHELEGVYRIGANVLRRISVKGNGLIVQRSGGALTPRDPVVLVFKQPGLKKEEPTLTDLCVYLAGATPPME
jgi:hypothetical protein